MHYCAKRAFLDCARDARGMKKVRMLATIVSLLFTALEEAADAAHSPVWTSMHPRRGSSRGGCLPITIIGSFTAGRYSCLLKRGTQRASTPAVAAVSHPDQQLTCMQPTWEFEAGLVQLILVREGYGPVNYQGQDADGEMFEFISHWQPMKANPSLGPASGGTLIVFSAHGLLAGYGWYRCAFRRNVGTEELQEMFTPGTANGTHLHCHTPPWGSLYAAAPKGIPSEVSIDLYDYDQPLSNFALDSNNTVSNTSRVEPVPAYCHEDPQSSVFVFSSLWKEVCMLECKSIHFMSA